RPELRTRRPDNAEELANDGIEPVDFAAADDERVLWCFAAFAFSFACLSLHQLQMDVRGIKGIAEFMGDTGGEQGERVQSLALDRFFRCASALGNVAHDNGVADLLGRSCSRGRCPRL